MGYNEHEKVQVKKEFILMLARMELDPARTELLLGFFETYLKLNQDEEHTLEAEFQNSNETEANVMEIISSYRKEGRLEGRIEGRIEGRKEGKLEGRKEGKLEGKREAICAFLDSKFDSSSTPLQKEITSINELQTLDHILEKIFSTETLDEAKHTIESAMNKH